MRALGASGAFAGAGDGGGRAGPNPTPAWSLRRLRWRDALAPAAGTAAYLALYLGLLGGVPTTPGAAEGGPGRIDALAVGLVNAARAPVSVLLPGLVGARDLAAGLPTWLEIGLTLAATAALLVGAARSRGRARAVVPAALALIFGGYALTFGARAGMGPSDAVTLQVQRYHLFPQLGAVLILALLARPIFDRLDRRPAAGRVAALALALALLVVHRPLVEQRLSYLSFPEQKRTLTAIDHLSVICREAGITRSQALGALDPLHPSWMPIDWYNSLGMLAPGASSPRVRDEDVRPILLASLSLREREALFGGLDATPFLRPDDGPRLDGPAPVQGFGVEPSAGPSGLPVAEKARRSWSTGWRRPPRSEGSGPLLLLPGTAPGRSLELWWGERDGGWSETRSLRWTTPLEGDPADAWAVPLERLPHFDPAHVHRVRIIARTAGPLTAGGPVLRR